MTHIVNILVNLNQLREDLFDRLHVHFRIEF